MLLHFSRTHTNIRIQLKHCIIIIYDWTGIKKQEKQIVLHFHLK